MRFAKLYDLPDGSQVLCYYEYVAEDDKQVVHQITMIDGIQLDIKLAWGGDQVEKAANVFEKYDRLDALRAREQAIKTMESMMKTGLDGVAAKHETVVEADEDREEDGWDEDEADENDEKMGEALMSIPGMRTAVERVKKKVAKKLPKPTGPCPVEAKVQEVLKDYLGIAPMGLDEPLGDAVKKHRSFVSDGLEAIFDDEITLDCEEVGRAETFGDLVAIVQKAIDDA